MPRLGKDVFEKCHRKLWEKATEEGKIKEDKLEDVLKFTAGFTVVNKYKKELENFGKIEEVEKGLYKVEEPEKEASKLSGNKEHIYIPTDEEIKKMVEELALDKEAIFMEAVMDKIGKKKEFLEKHGFDLEMEEEAEIIFELVINDAYKAPSSYRSKDRKHAKEKFKQETYMEVFDVDEIKSWKHLEKLRKDAFRLAEIIGKVDSPTKGLG